MTDRIKHWPHRLVALLLWLLFVLVVLFLIQQAPPWLRLQEVRIDLDTGDTVVLGQQELAAAAAEPRHLRIGRGPTGWWVQNIASDHKLLIDKNTPQPARRLVLVAGDIVQIGRHALPIYQASIEGIRFGRQTDNLSLFSYAHGALQHTGQPTPTCREEAEVPLMAQLKALDPFNLRTPAIMLGGMADCGHNVSLAGVAHNALQLRYQPEGWQLQPGTQFSQLSQPVSVRRAGRTLDLRDQRNPLYDNSSLIAGYSQFKVQVSGRSLSLIPQYRSQRVLERPETDPRIRQRWQADYRLTLGLNHQQGQGPLVGLSYLSQSSADALPSWLTGSALALVLFTLAYRWSRTHYSRPAPRQSVRLALFTSLTALSFVPFILPVSPLVALANLLLASLIWALQPVATATARHLRLLTLGLFMLGIAVQLQLALGAAESHWNTHMMKTATLCAAASWGILALCAWLETHKPSLDILEVRWRWLIIPTLGLLALQWLFGYEGGLGPFQPVELAKTVLVLITAAALAQRLDMLNRDYFLDRLRLWGGVLGVVILFLAVFGVLLMQLNDHSPIVLMTFWGAAMLAIYIYLSRSDRRRHLGLLAPAALLAMITLASVERDGLQDLELLPQSDRFSVWAQPALHPHSGYQFRAAQAMIQSGGLDGNLVQGLTAARPFIQNGPVMNVPAVQDDFMPTFVLHQFGALFALALVIVQCLVIHTVLMAGLKFRQHTQRADYRKRALGNFAFLVLAGSAGMLLGHFIVSWGSNLGYLPVMGQPMPLLSSAGSNLILFCAPLLAAAYVCAKEGNHDRS